jgi:hypothetical protein
LLGFLQQQKDGGSVAEQGGRKGVQGFEEDDQADDCAASLHERRGREEEVRGTQEERNSVRGQKVAGGKKSRQERGEGEGGAVVAQVCGAQLYSQEGREEQKSGVGAFPVGESLLSEELRGWR